MPLIPSPLEMLSRARADLRMGLPVVLREGEACLLAASAETLSAERLADLRALGAPAIAITNRRAETLKARAYDGDLARVILPDWADLAWVGAVADPAGDMMTPMKGPLATQRGDGAALASAAILLMKAARLLPAAVIVPVTEAPAGLSLLDLAEVGPHLEALSPLEPVIAARLPMEVSNAGRLHIFRPEDGAEEHYVVEIGRPDRDAPVLTRLHSACFTGDTLGSLKCDCGPQLRSALRQMGDEGAGLLLYLNQEGRGIGLANKMRAYSLQDQGYDTVEANHRLGFEDDERDFRIGAALLKRLGFRAVRLLTNNPAKVEMLSSHGLEVTERVPLKVGENPFNEGYLAVKAKKSGHLL